MGRYKVLPVFLRNKMAKVLVDVARVDWPHDYPEFLDNILQVIHTSTVDGGYKIINSIHSFSITKTQLP